MEEEKITAKEKVEEEITAKENVEEITAKENVEEITAKEKVEEKITAIEKKITAKEKEITAREEVEEKITSRKKAEDSKSNEDSFNGDGNSDRSTSNLPQTSNVTGPTRRLSFIASDNDGENIEMTALGASRQPQSCDQQQTQQNATNGYRIQLLHTIAYLVLSFISFFCSIIDLSDKIRYPSATPNYWNIVLEAVLAFSSLLTFCIIFHLSNKRATFSDRIVYICLFCSLLNLVSASVMYHLHPEWIAVAALISASILLFLLYVPWMMSNFADKLKRNQTLRTKRNAVNKKKTTS